MVRNRTFWLLYRQGDKAMDATKIINENSRMCISESEKSIMIFETGTGNVHYVKEKKDFENIVDEIKKKEYPPVKFKKTESDSVKINLSSICNLNCDYCFRDKNCKKGTDVEIAKKIIDFVVDKYRPGQENYTFSLNLTSESMIELDKIKAIKAYLDEKLYPFFNVKQFKDLNGVKRCLECLPKRLVGTSVVETVQDGVDLLNSYLDRKDLYKYFPMPEGMVLPAWEANEIAHVDELSGYALRLCNIRFLEAVFPETFIRKPCYVLYVCTNGMLFSDEICEFFRSININRIDISVDGPKEIHDLHRKDNAGKGSYDTVLGNIEKFKKAGFTVSVAAVMTPDFPKPLEIVEHLKNIGVASIAINPVRAGTKHSFTKESMKELLAGYEKLFKKLLEDVKKNDYSLLKLLKNDTLFIGINQFFTKIHLVKRCNWNEILIFDGKGDIYPCDYFLGKNEFKRGSIDSLEVKDVLEDKIKVENRGDCKDCWCKFWCGGTCFYNSYKNTGSIEKIDEIECMFSKGLRSLCIRFIHQLLDAGISLGEFAKRIDLGYEKNIEFDQKFHVKNAILFKFEGTLTKIELKLREFYEKNAEKGVILNPKFYITISEIRENLRSKVLYGTVIIPVESGVEKLNGEFVIKDFDFGKCFGGRTFSNDKCSTELKNKIQKQALTFNMPVVNGMWHRGTLDSFLGYSDEEVDIFMQRIPNVY